MKKFLIAILLFVPSLVFAGPRPGFLSLSGITIGSTPKTVSLLVKGKDTGRYYTPKTILIYSTEIFDLKFNTADSGYENGTTSGAGLGFTADYFVEDTDTMPADTWLIFTLGPYTDLAISNTSASDITIICEY